MRVIEIIAEAIGFTVLGVIALLLIAMAVSAVHHFIRTRNLKYDLYWYNDVERWNRWWRKRDSRPALCPPHASCARFRPAQGETSRLYGRFFLPLLRLWRRGICGLSRFTSASRTNFR